ncbi:hypothetical protein B0H19DRAFT_1246812 [Mycena capillaripes]|nr:hypothetical protein B0H19DRAFT_1246812 [Mycena capillaripes]
MSSLASFAIVPAADPWAPVINQMDTSQAHLSSKAIAQVKDLRKVSKDELTAVLKYGAQKIFNKDKMQQSQMLDEMDLDESKTDELVTGDSRKRMHAQVSYEIDVDQVSSTSAPKKLKALAPRASRLQSWGDIRQRYDVIVAECHLQDKNMNMILDVADEIIEICNRALKDHEDQRRTWRASGKLTDEQMSMSASATFRDILTIDVETVIPRHSDFPVLFNILSEQGDPYKWQIPVENIRPTLNWSVPWGPQDDSMLLVTRAGKFFLEGGQKGEKWANGPIPSAIHLMRRADYLLVMLRQHDEKLRSYESQNPSASAAKWEDQLFMVSSPPSEGVVASQSGPSTPTKRPASSAEHELSPAQKRLNTSQVPTPSPRSAASLARLDAMLRAQGQLPAVPEASTSTLPSTSVPRTSAPPSPASSYHTALPETSSLLPSWCNAQPSSTSFNPVTPPPTAERAERHWPPRSPRLPVAQSENVSRTRNENDSNSARNGMRNSVLGASTDARLDDPFSPSGSYTDSGGSEPRGLVASHSLASADAEELSVADEYMDFSRRMHAYITQLQERLEAAEKSNDAKTQKIERLQEENDRLKRRNNELETNLAQLT